MGIRHLSAVLYDMHGMDPTAKLILVALADHINDESGWGWPSLTRLSAVCGVHRRSVIRWLEWLEQHKYIEVKRRHGWANHYRLGSDAHVTSDAGVTRDARVTGLVTPVSKTSDAGVTRTRKNPKGTRRRPPQDGATPTPPPVADVLAHLENYR